MRGGFDVRAQRSAGTASTDGARLAQSSVSELRGFGRVELQAGRAPVRSGLAQYARAGRSPRFDRTADGNRERQYCTRGTAKKGVACSRPAKEGL